MAPESGADFGIRPREADGQVGAGYWRADRCRMSAGRQAGRAECRRTGRVGCRRAGIGRMPRKRMVRRMWPPPQERHKGRKVRQEALERCKG